ncbi:MAG TPA: hypothetical protein VKT75_11030 [Acidobacteriaceae bacterium]|nr:hypothetical protein [Acidobacteriaceae bacterium]
MQALGQFGCALLAISLTAPVWAQTPSTAAPAESALNLIRDVVYNETHTPERELRWEYRSERVTPGQHVLREQVETSQGTVFRVVAENGAPLDDVQRQQEEQRIEQSIQDTAALARTERENRDDEERLMRGLELLPQAMLFDYQASPRDGVVAIAFRPNPAYSASGFEPRIVHALTGTVLVDARSRRLIEIRGTVAERVDFGFGMLGHLEKGGTFVVHRRQINGETWKTDVIDVHLAGKLLLLKSFCKDQRETRSDFRPVPGELTLAQAKEMLYAAANEIAQMRLLPATLATAR